MTAPRSRGLVLAIAVVAFAGCAATVRPDELSAAAHRREAARERALADDEMARYEPGARGLVPGAPGPESGGTAALFWSPYNPTARWLGAADRHLVHAREHELAAVELETFEDEECRGLAPRARGACPLLGPVAAVEELLGGARIRFAIGAPVGHLAFARARGFERVADCPLYRRGVSVAASPDGAAIDVTTSDPAAVETIRQLIHAESGR